MSEEVSISIAPGGTGSGPDVVVTSPRTLVGWEDVEITLRCEAFPPTFRFTASSGMPSGQDAALAHAGDACFVRIGDDTVVTGYLTELAGRADAGSHVVEIARAGKTQDLAGEIEWSETNNYLYPTTAAIEKIASYIGLPITIASGAADLPPGTTPSLSDYPILLDIGVPAADYVNQIARLLGVLAYEGSNGSLTLARAGTTSAASGATHGQNVEAFSLINSMENRFSEVVAVWNRLNQFLEGDGEANYIYRATDPEVPRRRVKHLFVENGPEGESFTKRMADWEVACRAARSRQVSVTVDSWRDSAGTLWAPNTIVPLDLPGLATSAGPFGLSEVTFRRNNSTGTTAEMTQLPIAGFTPEPVQPTSANLIGVAGDTAGQ